MNGPRDLADVWAAVYAVVYVADRQRCHGLLPDDDSGADRLAAEAAAIADEAVKALHRVRGGEHG